MSLSLQAQYTNIDYFYGQANSNSNKGQIGYSEQGLRPAIAYFKRPRTKGRSRSASDNTKDHPEYQSNLDLSKRHFAETTTLAKGQKTCQLTSEHKPVRFYLGSSLKM